MGEGGFLGWPRSPSPPPSKEQRGEGDLLRGGGGFVVKGGRGVVEKGRGRGLLKTCIWGGGAAPSPPEEWH